MREVVIIGGGVIGRWCAWHLNQSGVQVTIVDSSDFSEGCSFGNAGIIVPSHFIPLASPGMVTKGIQWMFKKNSPFYIRPRLNWDLARWLWLFYRSSTRKHVEESAALLVDLHTESKEWYHQVQQASGLDFNLDPKGLLMLFKSGAAEKEEWETAELANRLGMETRTLTPEGLRQLEPDMRFDVRGAVYYPGDTHLSPNLFMEQMKDHLVSTGVEFLSHHEVIRLEDQSQEGCRIIFKNGKELHARHAVISSGSWSGLLMKHSGYRLPLQDGKGYSMTVKGLDRKPTIPAILHEKRVAITPMGDQLRIAGTLEISGMDEKVHDHKVNAILQAVPDYYPDMKIHAPGPVWYGYRPCSPDGMPYIGRWKLGSSLVLATGHAMMGVSLAAVTGRLVKDCILNFGMQPHTKLRPSRFSS